MPTPFPGMDPYLEAPEFWPDLHHELISVIRERLNVLLRPRYHSMVEERIYISDEHDPGRRVIVPDVAIQVASGGVQYRTSDTSDGSELAVAEPVVDYDKPPRVPLSPPADRWVAEWLARR